MKGVLESEIKVRKKIDNLLEENERLKGFYSFIGNKSVKTSYNYLHFMKDFLKYIGDKDFSELTLDDFTGFLMKKQFSNKGLPVSSSQKIGVYSALKKFGKYLVASEQLQSNPMDHIDRPKPTESQETIKKREIGYLDKKEINKFVKNINTGVGSDRSKLRQEKWKERDLAIAMVFLNTGMRCSALVSLDVSDFDFVNDTLTVTDKGSKVTTYDISEELTELIERWMVKRSEILGDIQEDALFISNRKQRISSDSVLAIIHKYTDNIQGKSISPHKLRATFGTQILNATGDLYLTQKAMGHSSPKTTELYIRGQKNPTKKTSEIMKNLTMKNLKDL